MKVIKIIIVFLIVTTTSFSAYADWVSGNAQLQGGVGVCVATDGDGNTVTASCGGQYATCGMSGIPNCGSCDCIIDLPNGQSISGNEQNFPRKITAEK